MSSSTLDAHWLRTPQLVQYKLGWASFGALGVQDRINSENGKSRRLTGHLFDVRVVYYVWKAYYSRYRLVLSALAETRLSLSPRLSGKVAGGALTVFVVVCNTKAEISAGRSGRSARVKEEEEEEEIYHYISSMDKLLYSTTDESSSVCQLSPLQMLAGTRYFLTTVDADVGIPGPSH